MEADRWTWPWDEGRDELARHQGIGRGGPGLRAGAPTGVEVTAVAQGGRDPRAGEGQWLRQTWLSVRGLGTGLAGGLPPPPASVGSS